MSFLSSEYPSIVDNHTDRLCSRKIKAGGVKMVLSGEGSDEIFGGYLYFHAAPTPEIFHQECVKRVKNLHVSDCLRANKCECARVGDRLRNV